MSLVQGKGFGEWQKKIMQGQITSQTREYLSNCEIKKIVISQATRVWEIYFQSPIEPHESLAAELAAFWEEFFGGGFQPKFYFEVKKLYENLELLCQAYWEEMMDRMAQAIPSSRGWLAEAKYQVNKDNLQILIPSEMGWSYLVSRGLKSKLEDLLQREYKYTAHVTVTLLENDQAQECELDEQLQELENSYLEKLAQSLEKSNGKKKEVEKPAGPAIIMGRKISGEPRPLNKVLEEENNVIIAGFIFGLESRLLKTGRTLFTFAVSDKTDSIACKIIADPPTTEAIQDKLRDGKWYVFKGTVQVDKFSQELTMLPRDIMEMEPVVRQDLAPEKRVELHLHTKMSTLDAVSGVKDIIKRAIAWGHPAIAITDHGVVQAFPEAAEAAGDKIKVIYGVEGYLYDDKDQEMGGKVPTYHIIILAANQTGLRNLYELITLSHLHHFYRFPSIPRSELSRLRKGLIIGSACEAGELIRAYLKGTDPEKLKEMAAFYDYLEIQPRGNNRFLVENGTFASEEELLEMNKFIYRIGEELGKPVVATGDVHFLDPEDEVYRRILMTGKGFEDADHQAPLYFKTTEEMLEEFAYLGKEQAYAAVVANPQRIAQQVEVIKPIPDELYSPEIPGAEDEIIRLTYTRAKELYGEDLPETVKKRVEKELNSIISNGFAVLYLIAHKLVKKSNEDGYLVGSRGSVGSSLVATLTGITEVNPLPPHYRCPACHFSEFIEDGSVGSGFDLPEKNCPHCGSRLIKDGQDIPFETFLGFKGDKVPDIDLNFSGEYQSRAHKYTEELFGRDNVFRAGTIATVATKTAYGFVKNYFAEKGLYVRTAEVNRLVEGCTGVKRTTGQHPGGVMVLPKGLDIHRFTPLQRHAYDVNSDTITTHFDYHSISSRLVKLDILGHDDPTVIKMLEDLTGVDSRTIPLDDKKVLSLFSGTEALSIDPEELGTNMGTLGIPEFGTKFVRQMLNDTKPTTFSELVRISGLSHGTDVWLNNAQELIKEGKAKLSEVIATRDDIMVYLIYQGVEPLKAFKVMEDVRKGKGIKPEDVQVLRENNVPEWYIESCQKIKYMFPKAHAAAYVMMAFRIAWFKVYYPAAFYASFFTVRADEFDSDIIVGGIPAIKKKMEEIQKKGNEATQKEEKLYTILELALEMCLRKITLRRVDLMRSAAEKFIVEDKGQALLPPFVSLQGLGAAAAQSIVNARNEKPFSSREDLRIRAKLSKTVLECLEKHGCLQSLPETDQISLF